ncbi:MAG: radical SAM protein [Candidatus Thermoplasmatota archaeon]
MKIMKNFLIPFHGLSFHMCKSSYKGMKPTFLIYQITERCNSRCKMCGIWKKKVEKELTIQEINSIFKNEFFSSLRWINITGGEPFLRRELVDAVLVFKENCSKLEAISIPTNGFLTDKILSTINEILDILSDKIFLSLTVSIDGIGKKHDEIRGVENGFEKAISTLKALKEIKKNNFEFGVETIVFDENIDGIEETYLFLRNYTQHINITPVIESNFFEGGAKPTRKNFEKLLQFLRKIENENLSYAYYYRKLEEIFLSERKYPCLAGYKTLYIDSKGYLYPCHLLGSEFSMGNLCNDDIKNLWFSENARNIRKKLENNSYCKTCTNNCDIINNLKEEGIDFLSFLAKNPKIFFSLVEQIKEGKMRAYVG